ncbi:SMI1/KNR4 family protein [Streptomyces sp. NBC_01506]|uniref:SMI1/KNR4 family protein n=1 Tax=Streptomyces sp. NBC_01506 TaxID=2903887 RepID=UPI00386A8671
MKNVGWGQFLERWSAEWAAAPSTREEVEEDEGEGALAELIEAGLGFPPADEERITALERRLGAKLPPSYRAFLAVSDGWRPAGIAVYLMGTTEGVHWHGDPMNMREMYEGNLTATSSEPEVLMAGMWSRALQLSVDSDMTDVLLDPGDVNAEGEWALYVYRGYTGEYPERYESFGAFMRSVYVDFHQGNGADPGFVNDTTRELDASLERARVACLAGEDIDRQMEVLAEAVTYGRPRAVKPHLQLTAMLHLGGVHFNGRGRLEDPLIEKEFMPLAATDHLRHYRDDDWFLRPFDEGERDRAAALLERIRERTYAYETPGPFGEAVITAREQARWGDTDGAWRTVEAALAEWEPYEDDHVAPIGLLADPLLGPLITPERGRRVLSTPRGPERVAAPEKQAADGHPPAVPDGLAWLADRAGREHSYRFVLAEGVSPTELAERLGGETLLPPHNQAETHPWHGKARDALDRVGSCGTTDREEGGEDWSFAFRDGTSSFPYRRVSPMGEKASRSGGRAVLVWCEVQSERSETFPDAFHFSYCEDGRERYGFTVRGGTTERSGDLPDALDPRHFFADAGSGAEPEEKQEKQGKAREEGHEGERRALAAVAEMFGLSLPRFAIQHGRLHAVATAPWTRPPGPGESRVQIMVHQIPARRPER